MRALITPYWTRRGLNADLWRDMDRFLESFNPASGLQDTEQEFSPATEITEDEAQYHLSVDLPGMRQEDIQIEVQDHQLSITGERKRESKKAESEKVQRFERSYGFFRRSFTLPKNVSTDKITAQYENGVLELSIPKAELAQARKIQIQSPSKAN